MDREEAIRVTKDQRLRPIVEDFLGMFGPVRTFELARETARNYIYDLRKKGEISFSDPVEGEVPSIHVVRKTLPEAWETTLMALVGIGQEAHTHYDPGHNKGKYESFPSLEASTTMHIEEPRSEPRFHLHFLTSQFGDYRAEMEGVKDHWVLNPEVIVDLLKTGKFGEVKDYTGWLYSYSQRMRAYPYIDMEGQPQVINQIQSAIDNLTNNPLSRSAQFITWDPRWDHNDGSTKYKDSEGKILDAVFDDYHAPCLQRIHLRLVPFKDGFKLNPNTSWRSRCHVKAVPHNVYGMIEGMIEPTRQELEKALKVPVVMGRYLDTSDSLHVYGHYLDQRAQGKDAEAYLEDIFRIARGEPIGCTIMKPGDGIYEDTIAEIAQEYRERKANPDKGRESARG